MVDFNHMNTILNNAMADLEKESRLKEHNIAKSNPEKYETKSFERKEIFTYSDYLVDAMTAHIDRERQKKSDNE